MTSGKFALTLVDSIKVNREERQRRDLTGIGELADSIKRSGLIHPIVITADNVLVAGERRLLAVRNLGWTHITTQLVEDLDPLQLQLIELEENTRRSELDWQDKCRAVTQYHAVQVEINPDWTQQETANALGISDALFTQYTLIVKEMESGNEDVMFASKLSVARGIAERRHARAKTTALANLEEKKDDGAPIIQTDFIEWSKDYNGVPFNFIHCDFPYGIGADKHDQGNAAARGGYEDTTDTYYKLIEAFSSNLNNFCAESAHVMFWFSMEYYEFTYDALQAAGFKTLSHPLVWVKSDNVGILSDPRRQPRRIYETALLGTRGDRHLVKPVANAFASPSVKTVHMSEKPKPVLHHFFRLFVDEFSTVLDPTCGSANALMVAEEMGAKQVLGLEMDKEFYELAKENYHVG